MPPNKFLARWHVEYVDTNGVITQRVVRVLAVHASQARITVWCELRDDERTFLWKGLRRITDTETGQPINLESWLYQPTLTQHKPAQSTYALRWLVFYMLSAAALAAAGIMAIAAVNAPQWLVTPTLLAAAAAGLALAGPLARLQKK